MNTLGTPRKIAYSFNNTNPDGYNPQFCYYDWPHDNLMRPCVWKSCPDQNAAYAAFDRKMIWDIENCVNVTEDTYTVQLGAWNPLDGWMWLDKPFTVEVLERIGPIYIDDFSIIRDKNETKTFHIRFLKMGRKTCITLDLGDGSKIKFYGNVKSCKMRYPHVTDNDVSFVDPDSKDFMADHKYTSRGVYTVFVTGFDERSYAEESLDITIFRMPCKVPLVWLPVNCTSWSRPERIPQTHKSKQYQVASMAILECNKTVETSMTWFIYSVEIKKDPASQAGFIEELTEIQINETVPSYRSSMISIPPRTLDYGLYKLVFKLEIETGMPELPLYKKAYTYFNITKSPLIPSFIKGSVAKVTRGWGQLIKLDARRYSLDPDNPDEDLFDYQWWCRRIDSDPPEVFKYRYIDTDYDGVGEPFPIYIAKEVQRIPQARDPIIIDPPGGCFGFGPGPVRVSGSRLNLNTSSLVTYAQIYEISLVLSKDTRVSQVKIEVDVGIIPAPIVDIECAAEGLCFPTFGGIFVNPTSRLALRGGCEEMCEFGDIYYNWNMIVPPGPLETISCDPELMTTSTTTTTTTTTSTTTTLPPPIIMKTATFSDSTTNIEYIASLSESGTIVVSFEDDSASSRRKRSLAIELGGGDVDSSIQGAGPLIPEKMPVGCSSVFTSGLSQNEFALTEDFFSMNSHLKEFSLELNITRCFFNGRKTHCSSGMTTLIIKINDPPYGGKCVIKNKGQTERLDYTNPGYNTALLDVFHISCSNWKDPNNHLINKYVFKSKFYFH